MQKSQPAYNILCLFVAFAYGTLNLLLLLLVTEHGQRQNFFLREGSD